MKKKFTILTVSLAFVFAFSQSYAQQQSKSKKDQVKKEAKTADEIKNEELRRPQQTEVLQRGTSADVNHSSGMVQRKEATPPAAKEKK